MQFETEDQAVAFVRTSFPDHDTQKLVAAMVAWYATETAQDASPVPWYALDEDDLREWAQEIIDTGGTFETSARQ